MALPADPVRHPSAPGLRPTGVTILGVLAIVAGALAVVGAFILLAVGAIAGAAGIAAESVGLGIVAAFGALAAVALFLYALFAFLVAYGLFSRRKWAWYAALVLAAFQILQGLGSLLALEIISAAIGLGIGGFIGWYLLSPPVQAWFGVSHNTPWTYEQARV